MVRLEFGTPCIVHFFIFGLLIFRLTKIKQVLVIFSLTELGFYTLQGLLFFSATADFITVARVFNLTLEFQKYFFFMAGILLIQFLYVKKQQYKA